MKKGGFLFGKRGKGEIIFDALGRKWGGEGGIAEGSKGEALSRKL